jgi:hypothetical protein
MMAWDLVDERLGRAAMLHATERRHYERAQSSFINLPEIFQSTNLPIYQW